MYFQIRESPDYLSKLLFLRNPLQRNIGTDERLKCEVC